MAKLYPPIILGTIPAFCGTTLKVPFQMNRAVGQGEVKGFYIKIKTVQNSRLIGTASTSVSQDTFKNFIINFDLSTMIDKDDLRIGQHYKIQIAYVGQDNVVGHYSTVGVVKYTNTPTVEIQDLDKKNPNIHQYSYLGVYAQEGPDKDLAEKLYSYAFNLYNGQGQLLETSGWLIYNSTEEIEPAKATCSFVLNKELEENERYYLEFEVLTNNELYWSSGKYILVQRKTISPDVDFELVIDENRQDVENGGIVISLKGLVQNNIEKLETGSFKLIRTDEESNYTEWCDILSFKLFGQPSTFDLFTDYTVKQGIKYKYAIVQYNEYGLQSNRIESDIISLNFEYMYLFDGERQLKIKYNPKVSSFKEVLLESKTETIGNKHPFIFRNGNVEYKEFPISGLISTLMDDNYLFFKDRKKDKNMLERNYNYIYKEIKVSDVKSYYFGDYWEQIEYTNPNWTTENYKDKWFTIKSAYSSFIEKYDGFNFNYKYRWINNKEEISNNQLSNEKIYYYPEVLKKLYIYYDEKYIHVDEKAPFSKTQKYYLISYGEVKDREKIKNNKSISYSFTNNYSMEAIQTERDFKLEVLDWLNNGKPKLFRSPTEGNYIIRLMNSSLTPNDQLGRVLHTFNSTAYEIKEYTFDNLKESGFIVTEDPTIKRIRWETIKLNEVENSDNLLNYKAVALRLDGMIPGDKIFINDGISRPTGEYDAEGKAIKAPGYTLVIGITGSYILDLDSNVVITEVKLKELENQGQVRHQGTLTYAYESAAFSAFDTIKSFQLEAVPIKQFFGKYDNIINEINNIKNQLQQIYFIHAVLRDQIDVYEWKDAEGNVNKYTLDKNGLKDIELDDRYYIYRIFQKNDQDIFESYKYFDGYSFKDLELTEEEIKKGDILFLNDKEIQVFNNNDFFLKETKEIKSIKTGYRILLEICYQSTITTYGAEFFNEKDNGNAEVLDALEKYRIAQRQYKTLWNSNLTSEQELYETEVEMNELYKIFIEKLEKELIRQGGIEGELV